MFGRLFKTIIMNEALSQAVLVLAIGMITVFLILGLVVISGQTLIRIVNHFSPEPVEVPSKKKMSAKKVAAIVTAVDLMTKGRGKVEKIEKL